MVLAPRLASFPPTRVHRAGARASCVLVVAALLSAGVSTPAWGQSGQRRVVAVGDIHGAGDRFANLLQQGALIDEQRRWTGGATTLVQTGDFTDRGPHVRAVMDLLMQIEADAGREGGHVHVLLGNHETMNLTANVRDATAAIFASFADDETERRREEAYRRYEQYVVDRREILGRRLPNVQTRDEWMRTHPAGFLEYLEAMGVDGRYGRWLREKPIATVLDGTVFLHGGLAPMLEADSVETLNQRAKEEIQRFDAYRRHLVERGVILPFSTFQEIFAAVALELNAWITRLFPGPPAPNRPPPSLTPEERAHLELLIDLRTIDTWSIIDGEGPLWFRGFARWSEDEGNQTIGAILERFDVVRAVVGHSVTASRRVTSRFDDRVFLIDTGMLGSVYRGRASALEFFDGRVTAIYVDERVPLGSAMPEVK